MRQIITLLILIALSWSAYGQDAQFSQYYAASLYLNPGFSGVYNDAAIHMNHKRQVQDVAVINELTQVSVILPLKPDGPLERSIGGVGLMAFNEKSGLEGVYERNSIFLNYAHNLKFGLLSSYLVSIGAQLGYDMQRLDYGKLRWGSQYNPFFGFDNSQTIPESEFNEMQQNFIFNAGIMYFFNPDRNYLLYKYSGFVGISATNLNRPNTSFAVGSEATAPILLKYNGGMEFKLNKLFVMPSLLYLYLRKNHQFNAGINCAYVPNAEKNRTQGIQLLFGTWYRLRDSFIFMGGIQKEALALRVSYDMNSTLFVSDKTFDLAQNSMEISIQYSFSKNFSRKKISNPLF